MQEAGFYLGYNEIKGGWFPFCNNAENNPSFFLLYRLFKSMPVHFIKRNQFYTLRFPIFESLFCKSCL